MEKLSYKIQEIAKGIWQIDEFSMDNIYVVEGARRAAVIDAGTGTGDLKSVIERLTDKPYDVFLTHAHVDHVGGMEQFCEARIHPGDIPAASSPNGPTSVANRRRYGARAFTAYPADRLPFTLDDFKPMDPAVIRWIPLRNGERFDLGGRSLEVIHTPGHSPGSVCFFDREDRTLFSGDAFLRVVILPSADSRRERLATWLAGACKIEARLHEIDRICAGHVCPLDKAVVRDLIECAVRALKGEIKEEECQVEEYLGPLLHYGSAYFTLDPVNLQTRDYGRLEQPRNYE